MKLKGANKRSNKLESSYVEIYKELIDQGSSLGNYLRLSLH